MENVDKSMLQSGMTLKNSAQFDSRFPAELETLDYFKKRAGDKSGRKERAKREVKKVKSQDLTRAIRHMSVR